MAKKQKNGTGLVGRIIITLVGILFILYAFNIIGLLVFGKTTTATDITTDRYEGIDSNQPVNKQYKWSVGWTFEVDGKEYRGATTLRGSAISVKYGKTVHYYPFAPQINSLFAKEGTSVWMLFIVALGMFLIISVNRKPRRTQKRFTGKTNALDSSAPFCRNCGAKLRDNSKFCPKCGGKVECV